MQVLSNEFKSIYFPLKPLENNENLFISEKNGKLIKCLRISQQRDIWEKQIEMEIEIQNNVFKEFPEKVLGILHWTKEEDEGMIKIQYAYNCDKSAISLQQIVIQKDLQGTLHLVDQILQIGCVLESSMISHRNIKPQNLIVFKEQILITDFGSARTNYQNYQRKSKNSLFFAGPQLLHLIKENSFEERYLKLTENQLHSIDGWAIGIVLIDMLCRNSQKQHEIDTFYGLNDYKLNQDILQIKQLSPLIADVIRCITVRGYSALSSYDKFKYGFSQGIYQQEPISFKRQFRIYVNYPDHYYLLKQSDVEQNESVDQLRTQENKPLLYNQEITFANSPYDSEQKSSIRNKLKLLMDEPSIENLLEINEFINLQKLEQELYEAKLKKIAQNNDTMRRFKIAIETQLKEIMEYKKHRKQSKVYKTYEYDQSLIPLGTTGIFEGSQSTSSNISRQVIDFQEIWTKFEDLQMYSSNQTIKKYQIYRRQLKDVQEIPFLVNDLIYFANNHRLKYQFEDGYFGGYWLEGKPHGLGILHRHKCGMIYQGFFDKGLFIWGIVIEITKDGRVQKYIGAYKDKVKHGSCQFEWYNQKGREFIKIESYKGFIVMGQIMGEGERLNENYLYRGQWRYNKKNGEGKEYMLKEGKEFLIFSGQFLRGLKHGLGQNYSEDEILREEGEYREGRKIGEHMLYRKDILVKVINYGS